jgi:integrase-like protein
MGGIRSVKEAVAKHIADAEARNLKAESLKKIRNVVEQRFLGYCATEGFRSLRQLDVDVVREFRTRLVKDYSPNSARKRLEYLRAFFRFCHQSGWMHANPATMVKPPKADHSPTLRFDHTQMEVIIAAADTFTRRENSAAATAIGFARWFNSFGIPACGFRMPRCWNEGGCPATSCSCIRRKPAHRFGYPCRRRLSRPCTSHRATTRSISFGMGCACRRARSRSGNSSLKVTEKHYAPWVKARQDQLEQSVRLTWPP